MVEVVVEEVVVVESTVDVVVVVVLVGVSDVEVDVDVVVVESAALYPSKPSVRHLQKQHSRRNAWYRNCSRTMFTYNNPHIQQEHVHEIDDESDIAYRFRV